MHINDLFKIKLCTNSKLPINKWTDTNNHFKEIKNSIYNIGILTGKINDLIVVDIDVKDEGIEEFDKYINEFGKLNTLIIKTPSSGFHYYFKYQHNDKECEFLINTYLTNKSKFRGKGIDIRSNGGYIVAPPSKINDKYYVLENDVEISQIPSTLINFLIGNTDKKIIATIKTKNIKNNLSITNNNNNNNNNNKFNNIYFYCIDDELIIEILSKLEQKYLNNYSDWLKVLTVLKNLNKYDIFDNWSKLSKNYNKCENDYLWNYNLGILDINYLIFVLNKKNFNYKYIEKYKLYEPITVPLPLNHIVMNNKYLFIDGYDKEQLNYDIFHKHDTIIIKSSTGTGKTTCVASHIESYIKNYNDIHFLSLTTRRTLSDQHILSFKNINMLNYQNFNNLYNIKFLTICINSLLKLEYIDNEQLTNYIIYIDEITSFLELTHNKTLDSNIKNIFTTLLRFIKYAKKIIVSDALITDNVFEFLKYRLNNNSIYIENTFTKYNNVNAHRIRDENTFLQLISNHCNNNEYFLFGSDSNSIITKYYNKCFNDAKNEDKHKYILITADTNFKIYNASIQFKNHFVFYSPKITFGIDMNVDDKQDVFIYMKGMSIQVTGIFQQATRCRNIKTLFYFAEIETENESYSNLISLKNSMKKHIKCYNNYLPNNIHNDLKDLLKLSTYLDENDELQISENTFFNLYCYNEYVIDIFKTNKICHLKNILLYNGFNLVNDDLPQKLNKKINDDMMLLNIKNKNDFFDNYIISSNRSHQQYEFINNNIQLLALHNTNDDVIKLYKNIIIDKFAINDHLSIINFLKSDEYIHKKLLLSNSFDLKNIFNIFHKIKLLRDIEKYYNIDNFNLDFNIDNEFILMTDNFFNLIKKVFKTTKNNPSNYLQLKKLIISMIRNITTSNIIITKKTFDRSKTKKNSIIYSFNDEFIQFHLKLNKYKNINSTDFHTHIIKKFNINVVSHVNIFPFDD